ncbi:hypothetical protein [Pseudarthrobacter sp. AB1]|uniref:hypothetical protein n=1 Tax=Pseudarthrobacter sp. AB1 TaxID=2138309 RepID=UPI00186BADE6|nr:hypothetical protein [Pseudarthrobacter sp. AB1]
MEQVSRFVPGNNDSGSSPFFEQLPATTRRQTALTSASALNNMEPQVIRDD